MNKILRRAEEKIKIPSFSDYKKIITEKYRIPELKQIASHYKLKNLSGKKKQELLDTIFNYLRESYYSCKLQRICRGYLVRKYVNLHGPGFLDRSKCVNSEDFYLMDELEKIDYTSFISFRDEIDGKIYGFHVLSLKKLILQNNTTNNIQVSNPYTRNPLNINVITQLTDYIKLSKLLKIKISCDDEMINVKLTKKQRFNQRITNVFKAMDDLGNYTDISWFTSLTTNIKHVKFIKELHDIWAYRAQLTNEVKNKICNFKDPFTNLGIMHANMINNNYDVLANISLTLIEKMVYSGIDQDSRSLGALYVLTSLTLVSPNAADAMPWLYNSVV